MAESNCVDALVAAIEGATIPSLDGVFTDDTVLDATVPNWRFTVRGGDAVVSTLAGWFADAGRFEELQRTPLPDGELVEFTLTWIEDGVPHMCHQVHRLRLDAGRISGDTAFCGGRWPQPLLDEMRAAAAAH